MTENTIQLFSPIDGSLLVERQAHTMKDVDVAVKKAQFAQQEWRSVSIAERAVFCQRTIDILLGRAEELGLEITRQMGRPIRYTPGELRGLHERGQSMIDAAWQSLEDIETKKKPGFNRFIRRVPLGIVLTVAPWNYPYLTAVNSIVPALMAGNAVLLKHSAQTLLCAEQFQRAFQEAGLPEGLFGYLHLDHPDSAALMQRDEIRFVSFTGSVAGGESIEKALAGLFKPLALELGGKDPAYVCDDANLDDAIDNLVDGAFFNSGQSCCGIERIYVHQSVYDRFVEAYITQVNRYVLGNPLDHATTLGPLVTTKAACFVQQQIDEAISKGARHCIDAKQPQFSVLADNYLPPQVLLNVDHSMSVMTEESFGPVVGIMKVKDDQEALHLMNDSRYGLTASLWTQDELRAQTLGNQLETGTVFMNRCDYLDPELAWVGVKESGRGCALSSLGYGQLTRPKSFHLKLQN